MVARGLGGFQSADCLLTTSRLQAQFPHLEKGVVVVRLSRKALVRPLRQRQCPAISAVFVPHTCTYVAPWVCQELVLDRAERGHAQSLLRQAQFCAQDQLKIPAGYMAAAHPRMPGGGSRSVLVQGPMLSLVAVSSSPWRGFPFDEQLPALSWVHWTYRVLGGKGVSSSKFGKKVNIFSPSWESQCL